MTKKRSTKRALLMSGLALLMCVSMLVGSTFAWFTDSVTSANNIIKTGTLEIGMYWAEGDEDPATFNEWKDASKGAIFNYDKWEPGYSEAKHIKIVNEGSLALNYQMRILANGIVTELADVIDVYYFSTAKKLDRSSFTDANKLGTLSEILNNTYDKALTKTVIGSLEAEKSTVVTLAFKMQESAGNEYQNLSIGSDFSVQLLATQKMSEFDSFGNDYDEYSKYPTQDPPSAMVSRLVGDELNINATLGLGGPASAATLTTGYQFEPTEPGDLVAADSAYRWWHADFIVSADKDVKANTLALAGYYSLWCNLANNGNWATIPATEDIKANTPIRLVETMGNGAITVNYGEICNYGNDGVGFRCGIIDNGATPGTTITVTLRLFEVENANSDSGSHNVETGRTIDIGTFEYVIGGDYRTMDDGAVYFYGNDGYIQLYDATNVTATEYTVAEGTVALAADAFAYNTNTKTVIIPASVTDFGGDGNGYGGAFKKNSTVETIILNEGLTAIPDAAFQQASALKNINIPSTVKTIGLRAFRAIGATDITVPATVAKIDESFRDITALTTVTFEGNTEISPYAFRDCTNLKNVYLKGEDITFATVSGGGNKGMYFTSQQTGAIDGINVYVENNTVAERYIVAENYTGYNLYVNGKQVKAAKVANANQLQTALNNATSDTIIVFTANIGGDVTVNQPGDKDVNIIINGCNYKYDGVMSIKGNSDFDGKEDDSLLIKNINFETSNAKNAEGRDAFVWTADSSNGSAWRYAHNVTVDNCTFTAVAGSEAQNNFVGVKIIQAYNFTVTNCTATNTHSLLQAESCGNPVNLPSEKSYVVVDGCETVNSKNGVSFNNTANAVIKNCNIEAVGNGSYGIRHKGEINGYALTVENCNVKAFVPILIRNMKGNGYTADFSGDITLNANNIFDYQIVVSAGDWDNDSAEPSAPTGTYTITGASAFTSNAAYTK